MVNPNSISARNETSSEKNSWSNIGEGINRKQGQTTPKKIESHQEKEAKLNSLFEKASSLARKSDAGIEREERITKLSDFDASEQNLLKKIKGSYESARSNYIEGYGDTVLANSAVTHEINTCKRLYKEQASLKASIKNNRGVAALLNLYAKPKLKHVEKELDRYDMNTKCLADERFLNPLQINSASMKRSLNFAKIKHALEYGDGHYKALCKKYLHEHGVKDLPKELGDKNFTTKELEGIALIASRAGEHAATRK